MTIFFLKKESYLITLQVAQQDGEENLLSLKFAFKACIILELKWSADKLHINPAVKDYKINV